MNDCIFCLASLFIQADMGYQLLPQHSEEVVLRYDRNGGSPLVSAIVVGMQADFSPKYSMQFKVRHESMPTVYDYGINAVWVTIEWRPFR
jgi:hypothetical protein